jgi:hypothetical protein
METSFVSASFGGGYSTAVVKLGFDIQTLEVVRPNNVVSERQLNILDLQNLTHDEIIKFAEKREREEEEREVQAGLEDLETEAWTRKFLEGFPKIQLDNTKPLDCVRIKKSKPKIKDIPLNEDQLKIQLEQIESRIAFLKSISKR